MSSATPQVTDDLRRRILRHLVQDRSVAFAAGACGTTTQVAQAIAEAAGGPDDSNRLRRESSELERQHEQAKRQSRSPFPAPRPVLDPERAPEPAPEAPAQEPGQPEQPAPIPRQPGPEPGHELAEPVQLEEVAAPMDPAPPAPLDPFDSAARRDRILVLAHAMPGVIQQLRAGKLPTIQVADLIRTVYPRHRTGTCAMCLKVIKAGQ